MPKCDPDQQSLPYSALIDERLAQIRSLERVLDLAPSRKEGVIELLQRIALLSRDGETSNARVSAIAASIRQRRSVSERTIRRWCRDAEALDLLKVDRCSQQFGGWASNQWRIQLLKLKAMISSQSGADMGRTWGGHLMSAPGRTHAAAPKYESLEGDKYSGTGTGDRTETADGFEREGIEAADSRDSGPVARPESIDPRMGRIARDALRRCLLVDVPLLVEAAGRSLAPRPCSQLTGFGHGVFTGLQSEHLRKACLIDWHLEQLSGPEVFAGPTEADLLLTLSAGEYAGTFPQAELRKNRVALFVSVVSRSEWRRVLKFLDEIRGKLDRTPNKFWLATSVTVPSGG